MIDFQNPGFIFIPLFFSTQVLEWNFVVHVLYLLSMLEVCFSEKNDSLTLLSILLENNYKIYKQKYIEFEVGCIETEFIGENEML